MRIELPHRGELVFQEFGKSKKRHILNCFWKGSKGRSGEAFVTDITDFASAVDSQRGSILEEKTLI